MANLDFIEKDLIDRLLNNSGYVLDFTNKKFQAFVYGIMQIDVYTKYHNLSKGKILNAILDDYDDKTVGKLLLELLRYMQNNDMVKDDNKVKFIKCAEIGNRLIGKTDKVKIFPNKSTTEPSPITSVVNFEKYSKELQELSYKPDTPQERGFAFEKYLQSLFEAFSLEPRGSFKTIGDQIDGSFILRDAIYLLEAKWTSDTIDKGDLVIFNEKVSSRSGFSRGLFISFSTFSDGAIKTFATGRTINIILMTVQELAIMLSKQQNLDKALWLKVRALAEEGKFFKNVMEL
jgi:hypothetical protein